MKTSILISFALLVSFMNATGQSKQAENPMSVREGAAGIYVFTFLSEENKAGNIYRSEGDSSNYKLIGVVKAAATEEEFRRMVGENSLKTLARLKKLSDERAAFAYVGAHPDPKDYGLAALDINFFRAIGACYLDEDRSVKPKGTKLFYKIEYKTKDNQVVRAQTFITLGIPPAITRPIGMKASEKDSSISVSWSAPAAGSDDALMGIVYRSYGSTGDYEKAGTVFAQRDGKNERINYQWHETVVPERNYNYFVVPVTLAGLPGPVSDTIAVISHNFKSIPALALREGKDTTQGIFISWDAITHPEWYSAILVERSKKSGGGFETIDSVDISETTYTDTRVIPNILYYYQIRLVTIRQNISDPSSYVTATHQSMDVLPDAPEAVTATVSEKGVVKINWFKATRSIAADYMVFRTGGNDTAWQLVSNLQKENSFSDSISNLPTAEYKYMVRSVSYSGAKSNPSAPAFISWINRTPPGTIPTSLTGYAEQGKSVLIWRDVKGLDNDLVGYNVYRKESNSIPSKEMKNAADLQTNGFKRINPETVRAASYTDLSVKNGNAYVYVITGMSLQKIEGRPGSPFLIKTPATVLYAPAGIAVRNTSAGVVIDWGRSLQEEVDGYEIFRRSSEEKESIKIGKVTAKEDSFTDKKATQGKLYFYSIKAIDKDASSDRSEEISIRL